MEPRAPQELALRAQPVQLELVLPEQLELVLLEQQALVLLAQLASLGLTELLVQQELQA
jgi:hypothetical protein